MCSEWINKLANFLKNYESRSIFNADKTALFYKCLVDRKLIFKNEKCHGSKHSKERVTILLGVNMTGLKNFSLY